MAVFSEDDWLGKVTITTATADVPGTVGSVPGTTFIYYGTPSGRVKTIGGGMVAGGDVSILSSVYPKMPSLPGAPIRVLVTGDRKWTNYQLIEDTLSYIKQTCGIACLINGAARGADKLSSKACVELGITWCEMPAEWEKFGRSAGPIRNRKMLNTGQPELVVAFHNNLEMSKGTKDMVNISLAKGIQVILVTEGPDGKVYVESMN